MNEWVDSNSKIKEYQPYPVNEQLLHVWSNKHLLAAETLQADNQMKVLASEKPVKSNLIIQTNRTNHRSFSTDLYNIPNPLSLNP